MVGDEGAEVLLEKVMNEILQAEMTDYLSVRSKENRPATALDIGTACTNGR